MIAIGEAVDNAGLPRLLGQQRPGQHIGFDIDHDDMLAGVNRSAGMGDPGGGMPGRLDHHLNIMAGAGSAAVVRKLCRGDQLRVPANAGAGRPRADRIEVGDHGDFQSGRMRDLGKKHRPELASPDQRDAHGFAGGMAPCQEREEIHGRPRASLFVVAQILARMAGCGKPLVCAGFQRMPCRAATPATT